MTARADSSRAVQGDVYRAAGRGQQIRASVCYTILKIPLAEQESRPGLAPRDPGTPTPQARFDDLYSNC